MSYLSFEGSLPILHEHHQWVAVGHETANVAPPPPPRTLPSGKHEMRISFPDWRYYIVRACQLCPEVWWQEYKPTPLD